MTSSEIRPRVLLDCDPGLDDAIAIAVAAHHTDLVGITTVGGNVSLERTTANALALCDLLGITHVPVHAGEDLPLGGSLEHRAQEYHGPNGTGSVEFPPASRGVESDDAVGCIIDTVRAEEGLWLVATGPLTNVARAVQAASDIVDRVAGLAWMGGSSTWGNTTAAAEFNAWVDPEAADRVFRAGFANLTMLGLNVTQTVLLDRVWIDRLRADVVTPAMAVFADLLEYYDERQRSVSTLSGAAVHDVLAVLAVTHPHLLAGVRRPVEVVVTDGPARGMTLVDQRPRRDPEAPNATVVEWADAPAIQRVIHAALILSLIHI